MIMGFSWPFSVQLATVLWVLSSEVTFGDDGHCIWYGQCTTGNKAKNCYYNGPAKRVLDDKENGVTMLETLKSFCPNLYTGNDTVTCCDYDQLQTLVKSMNFPAPMYSRCPSCWADYRDLFCASTCDPHMSKFLQVQATNESNVRPFCPNPPCQILQIGYLLTEEYANTLYNACDHVQFPSSNRPVIGSFCGSRTAEQCNATYFLNYQGSTANGFAPFEIKFTIIDHYPGHEPYNRKLYRCNEALNGTHCGGACSCSDCPASCSSFPSIPKGKSQFKIGSVDGITMVMIIIYCSFIVVFVTLVLVCICRHKSKKPIISKSRAWINSKPAKYYNGVGVQPGTSPYSTVRNDLDDMRDRQRLLDNQQIMDVSSSGSINDGYGAIECQPQLQDEKEVIEKAGYITRMGVGLEYTLMRFFRWWGTFCATHPFLVILACIVVVATLSLGMLKLTVTTDPVKLWSSPNSQSRQEKDYFDSHFGPFYRTEQVIIRAPNSKPFNYTQNIRFTEHILFGGVFTREVMEEVFWLQENITNLKTDGNITLNDICFQPLKPDNDHCAIESVWQYFQNNFTNLDMILRDSFHLMMADYHTHLLYCFNDPTSVNSTTLHHSCLADYGGLVPPDVALGGYDDSGKSPPYAQADTLFLTIIVNNHIDESKNKDAEAWEKVFIDYMKNFTGKNITVAFMSERSVSDEISRESNSEILTVAISYILMFLYVAIFLGHIQSLRRVFIDSKVALGLAGVLIVLSAVVSSIGLFSYFGQPMTLIVVEVIPFLVLAVGVDNIFILVQAFQRHKLPESPDLRDEVGIVLGTVAPSMLLTGIAESIAFFLGALTSMPAVRSFSLYAGMAIFLDFLLQVTCFVALLYLDAKRQLTNRLDVVCCIRVKEEHRFDKEEGSHGYLYRFFRDYYSHFIMNDVVRAIVMLAFVGGFAASVVAVNHLHVGLDQKLSMPTDSYLQDYFREQAEYARVGPPVYFVVKSGLNYSEPEEQNRICSLPGCNNDSLTAQLSSQATIKQYSMIANPPNSWLDDYLIWVSPSINCCRIYEKSGNFCSAKEPMDATYCEKCLNQSDLLTCFSPKPNIFYHFLRYFLKDNPGIHCSKGGHAAYQQAVDFKSNSSIESSYFSTYHTTLANDTDFIDALKRAREISKNLTQALNGTAEVFPYSLVYVYYEQYLTIAHDAGVNLGLCAAAIFVVTFLLMGFSVSCAIIVTVNVAMIVVDLMGIMYLWDISLNAVSVVNLVMAVGISVEFCSHITRSFAVSRGPDRVTRAKHALTNMGSSVLSGITLTKFVGIVVLALSKSQLFKVFYFRMYLGIVLLGAGHGLVFLPVLLSYLGPASMPHADVLMKREIAEEVSSTPSAQRSSERSPGFSRPPYQSTVPDWSSPATVQVSPQSTPQTETVRRLGNASD